MPLARRAPATASADVWHWLKHEREGWVAGKRVDAARWELSLPDGGVEMVTMAAEDVGPQIHAVDELETLTYADMIRMSEVNEGSILHNLRRRFVGDDPAGIFTAIGQILVSINPYAWMAELYAMEVMTSYAQLRAGEEAAPHIFGVANNAYKGMRDGGASQAIIISGAHVWLSARQRHAPRAHCSTRHLSQASPARGRRRRPRSACNSSPTPPPPRASPPTT